jgi:hypothetical protein
MQIKIFAALTGFIITFSSCTKDPRSVTYKIDALDDSVVSAIVTGTEKGDKTEIGIVIFNASDGKHYEMHFHEGAPSNYIGYAPYTFHHIHAKGNKAIYSEQIDLMFDEFTDLNATCVVHPMGNADVLARAGIGRNAPK